MVNPALPMPQLTGDSLRMWRRATLTIAILWLAVSTGDTATVAVPKSKPAITAAVATIPLPRPNPRRQQVDPPAKVTGDPAASGAWPKEARAAALAQCNDLLAGLDLTYSIVPAIGRQGGCGTVAPIELTELAGIRLTPSAIVNCEAARLFYDWITLSLQPAAKRRLKTEVTEIHVAASYVCRRRNNASSGKLSEHGRANAIDMSGFSFAKSKAVAVGGSWGSGLLSTIGLSSSGSFLSDIRKGACTHFTTVLGPGSDRYHGGHFHVDALQRHGGYRICK